MEKPVKLSDKEIKAIEHTLAKGERLEITPTKNGLRICKVFRKEIEKEKNVSPA